MENQVYRCTWRRVDGGYELSTKTKPRLVAFDKSFDVAEDNLHGEVCGKYGDGESVFEFDPAPPLTAKSKSLFEPLLFVFDANGSLRQKNDEEGLYTKGYCECCGGGMGRRTKKVRTLQDVPKNDVSFLWSAKPQVFFYSAKMVAFLCRAGLSSSAFQEVRFTTKTSRKFLELVAEPEIKFVGIKHPLRPTGGWQCAKCGMKWFHPFHRAAPPTIFNFLSRSDLSRVSADVFITGHSYERDICMSGKVATRARRLRGLKGIVTSRVAILEKHEIVKYPKVKILKKGDFA